TIVNKGSSNLDVSNTCNYNIDNGNEPVSCSIIKNGDRYELRIENKNNSKITYGLSDSGYRLNGITVYNSTSQNFKLYGAIAVNDNIVATCNYEDEDKVSPLPPDD